MNEGLRYLIRNNLENEKRNLIIEEITLIKEYQYKICSECSGTDKQKKRDCGKLNGFSTFGCECMNSTISKKMKQKNLRLLNKLISFEILKSQKAF